MTSEFENLVSCLVQDIVANEKDAVNYGDEKKPTKYFVEKYLPKFHEFLLLNGKELVSKDIEDAADEYLSGDKSYVSTYERKGFINGAKWKENLDKENFNLVKQWFEDIAEKCNELTSGNVSHKGKYIRGFAKNCAEYVENDILQA